MKTGNIRAYDSFGGPMHEYAQKMKEYLCMEEQKKKETTRDWHITITTKETPKQVNGCDCGVFMCMFAYYISRNMPVRMVEPEGMDTDRAFIGLQILNSVNILGLQSQAP